MSNRHEGRSDVRRLEDGLGYISFGGESLERKCRNMEFLNPKNLRCESGRTVWWILTRPTYILPHRNHLCVLSSLLQNIVTVTCNGHALNIEDYRSIQARGTLLKGLE